MQSGTNMVIVKVDRETNDLIETNIVDQEGNKVELILDTSFEKLKNARISGEVIGVPKRLKDPGMIYYEHSPGSPKPVAYRGHDKLCMIGRNYPPEKQTVDFIKKDYRPTAYTPTFETVCGKDVEVQCGDTIWFHYLCIDDDNYLGRSDDGMKMYRVFYDQVFGYKRDADIQMINGYCMVQPYYGDGFEEIEVGGKTINAKTETVAGMELVTEVTEKPKYLHGIVYNIGKPVGPQSRDTVKKGDHILYAPLSDFPNNIEGKDLYVMRQWDIVGKVEGEEIAPVGDYVAIKPDEYQHKGLIMLRENDLPKPNTGKVMDLGETVDVDIEIFDEVRYGEHSLHMVPVPEFDRVLVRQIDLWYKLN